MSITLFGKDIPLYGIFFYLGIAVAAVAGIFICKKRKMPLIELVYSGIYTFIGALLGAKLLFIAVSLKQIIEYNIPLINVVKGGFVFYGGMIGGLLGLWIYTKQFKLKMTDYMDIFATVLPLGHAFGRVGCFFAGCCYGMPYEHGYVYHTSAGATPLGIPLFPIQLVEAGVLVILFVFQVILTVKYTEKKNVNTYFYLVSYPSVRFVLEFFRGDDERGKFLYLSTSQWISILIILATMSVIVIGNRKRRKTDRIKIDG